MSKGRPWKTLLCDGFEVRIGRSAADNDELTNGLGADDVWLHVAEGYAGSHVGVINGNVAPEPVVRQAARWAVWHSSARREASVGVYVVPGDDVTADDGFASIDSVYDWVMKGVEPEQPPTPAQPPPAGLHVDPLWSVVTGALRMAVDDHGPIDKANLGSATKRVLAAIRGAEKADREGHQQ